MSNGETTIGEAMVAMEPKHKAVLSRMIIDAGGDSDMLVKDVLSKFTPTNGELLREERLALLHLAFMHQNKFAPKLTFTQRCEVLALFRFGLSREAIANIYGIDRRTVTHIHNPMSPHYKNVRDMETGLGSDKFMDTYLRSEILDKALAYRQERETMAVRNNKMARGKEGIHVVRGKECTYDHRVVISWREKNETINVSGWYYRDMDGDFPENWLSVDEESLRTSQSCYAAMLRDISDKMA